MLWASSSSSSNTLLSTAATLLSSSTFPLTPSNSTATISDGRLWVVGGATAATCLMLVEGTFALLFYKVLVPRLQQLRPPAEYRGYARDRRRLLNRILQRFEATCHATNTSVLPFIESYIRQWFHPIPKVTASTAIENGTHNSTTTPQALFAGTTQRTNSFGDDRHNEEEEKKDNDKSDDGGSRGGHVHQAEELASDLEFWPKKQDMDEFLSWAFFGSDSHDMKDWMIEEMNMMYETLETKYGITFEPGQCTEPYRIQPMRVTLDPLEPTYRPFFLYGIFATLKSCANIILRMSGFQHYTTSTGLKYWYRPERRRRRVEYSKEQARLQTSKTSSAAGKPNNIAENLRTNENEKQLPLLFLHGIAPGGFALYLPMLFFLGNDGRPLFFFENPGISFGLQFWSSPPSEQETTTGVWEAVHKHLGNEKNTMNKTASKNSDIGVSVLGHSFGSCSITWLIHSQFAHYIKQVVLVDPVSILLHEPDVVTNFLYQRKMEGLRQEDESVQSADVDGSPDSSQNGEENEYNNNNKAHQALKKKRSTIRVVANEIFTEYYLRRHFAWYNSELWLDDIPPDVKVLVCLSEHDQIVATEKVRRELYRVKSSGAGRSASDLEDETKHQFTTQESADSWYTAASSISDMDNSLSDDIEDDLDGSNIEVLTWKGAGHAHCVTRPHTWKQMQFAMKQQEERIHTEHKKFVDKNKKER